MLSHMDVEEASKHADGIAVSDFCKIIWSYPNFGKVDVVLELGSRDGRDAFMMQSMLHPSITVAVEAHPKEYKLHKKTMKVLGIEWVNTAIYNYDGTVKFYPKSIGSGIHSIRDRGEEYGKECTMARCKRVSTLCNDLGITNIDVVKVDVEGCAYECLEGFGPLLKTVKAIHLETETVPFFRGQHLHNEVCELLLGQFELQKMSGAVIQDGIQLDSVWFNKDIVRY